MPPHNRRCPADFPKLSSLQQTFNTIFTSDVPPKTGWHSGRGTQLNHMEGAKNSSWSLSLLSSLVLATDDKFSVLPDSQSSASNGTKDIRQILATCGPQDFGEIWGLATSHHVIMRAFPALHRLMVALG